MSRKLFLFCIIAAMLLLSCYASAEILKPSVDFSHGKLNVSQNNRFLVHADGTPFFYLGDTAWELFHRLNREEAEKYLENRRQKGFTVIQTVALAELDGLRVPNAYGHRPLLETDGKFDPAKPDIKDGPNNDYWDHVDFIVKTANEKGLYIGFLPTWGDKWNKIWGKGPEVFTPENARAYSKFLGKRYKDAQLIWILGGDRNPGSDKHMAITDAMAEGLIEGDGGSHLLTFHPQGGSTSTTWFNKKDWLSFNMLQSGHGGWDIPNYKMIEHDYNLSPRKPCLDGEPRYENHPVNWKADEGWFDDRDVRQALYWSVFAGGCGVTYGCHDIWQMMNTGKEPIAVVRNNWYEAIDLPGAFDVIHLRRLIESRPMLDRVPDQSIIASGQTDGPDHIQATRGKDYAFIYIPYGNPFEITLGKISGEKVKAYWFNPREGYATLIGTLDNRGKKKFDPPSEIAKGNDWVLVLDDASKNYPAPGTN